VESLHSLPGNRSRHEWRCDAKRREGRPARASGATPAPVVLHAGDGAAGV